MLIQCNILLPVIAPYNPHHLTSHAHSKLIFEGQKLPPFLSLGFYPEVGLAVWQQTTQRLEFLNPAKFALPTSSGAEKLEINSPNWRRHEWGAAVLYQIKT